MGESIEERLNAEQYRSDGAICFLRRVEGVGELLVNEVEEGNGVVDDGNDVGESFGGGIA